MVQKPAFNLQLKLLHKGLLLVLIPLAIEFVFIATLWHLLDTEDSAARRVAHAKQVVAEVNDFQGIMIDLGRAAFVFNVSHTDTNRQAFLYKLVLVHEQIEKMNMLYSSTPQERENFDKLRGTMQRLIFAAERQVRINERYLCRNDIANSGLSKLLKDASPKFRDSLIEILQLEKNIEGEQLSEVRWRNNLRMWIAVCLGIHLILAVAVATYFYRNMLRRLHVLLQNANRLAAGRQLLPPLKGSDEIDQVDAAFHKMADELANAAEYKRQMISVVSHELRTPLTAIRGSLTLMTAGILGALTATQLATAEKTEAVSGRLIELINALLDKEKEQHEPAK